MVESGVLGLAIVGLDGLVRDAYLGVLRAYWPEHLLLAIWKRQPRSIFLRRGHCLGSLAQRGCSGFGECSWKSIVSIGLSLPGLSMLLSLLAKDHSAELLSKVDRRVGAWPVGLPVAACLD